MGLDAYLYSTGKVHRKQSELEKELVKYKHKIWDENYKDIFKDAPITSYERS